MLADRIDRLALVAAFLLVVCMAAGLVAGAFAPDGILGLSVR